MPHQAIGDVAGKSHVGNARQVARQERIVAIQPAVRIDRVDHLFQSLWSYGLTSKPRPSRVIGQDDRGQLRDVMPERLKHRCSSG